MNRPYALKRLLEHGALTYTEMREITGWKPYQLYRAVNSVRKAKIVRRVGSKWRLDLPKEMNERPSAVGTGRGKRTGGNVLVSRQDQWAGTGKTVVSQANKPLDQVLRTWV